MTATSPTRAPAHFGWDLAELGACTTGTYFIIDRDALCLPLMTDAQALATWERMKAVRKAYVEAIIEKVPA